MTADGKIADVERSPARFGSQRDRAHLEQQVALADGVIFGAGTLRAHGSAMTVRSSKLLEQRHNNQRSPQPVQIVCTRSGNLDPDMRFFHQQVPRWLLTNATGAIDWQQHPSWERLLIAETPEGNIDWENALTQLLQLGIENLAVLGGGELMADLFAIDAIDELWLTLCPLIFGGSNAPTLVEGSGFTPETAKSLQLLDAQVYEQEIFLHYRVQQKG